MTGYFGIFLGFRLSGVLNVMIQFPIGLNNLDVQYESDVDSCTFPWIILLTKFLTASILSLCNVSQDILDSL